MLESLCQGDEELLKEVRSLLKACEQEELATASAQLAAGKKLAAWSSRRRIGAYELDRLIGHGGMGPYTSRAVQTDSLISRLQSN